jgi:hypothetical protein
MSGSLKNICDHYIDRCRQVLNSKDIAAAKVLREEATLKFHAVVPRWNAGLMASITQYYLDDIESIFHKLVKYRAQLGTEGDQEYIEVTQSRDLQNQTRPQRRSKIDSFEQTCLWIRDCYAASATEKADILARVYDLQKIAISQSTLDEKWDKLCSLLGWIRSLNADLAARMLPLFVEILD